MSRQQAYVNEVYSHAREMGMSHVQASLAASQAALETGYGKSVKGNNHFGIKAGRSWSGPSLSFTTHEERNGVWEKQKDSFRGYRDMKDSIRDYATFLEVAFPDAWNAQTFDDAVNGLNSGKYGRYATDSKYGSKLGYINDRFGAGLPQVGPSKSLQAFTAQNQQLDPFSVDTSWSGLANMNVDRTPTPESKPSNPANPAFADNAIGPLAERMGSYDAPVSTVTGLMEALGAASSPASTVAMGPSRDAVIDGYQQNAASRSVGAPSQAVAAVPSDRFDQAFSAFERSGVPASRFDQAFSAFGAPNTTAATTSGLPDLDAPQTVETRSAPVGYAAPETLTGTPGTPATTTGQPGIAGPLDKGRVNGAIVGSVIGGPLGALAGYALGPAVGRQGQSRGVLDKGRNTNSRGRGIGRGVSRAIGGVIAGPLGALAAPTIGRSLSNFGDFSLGGIATPEGWAGAPEGMGYAAAMNGGSFWDGYTAATGGSNLNPESGRDFARAMATEQAARSAKGQSTWGDAFSDAIGKDSDSENESDGGGCFLTTAAVDVTGEADNGDTLQTLRWFRDNIMRARPDWSADVDEYYRIAPAIVERLNGDNATYERLMTKHIRPAVKAIKAGEYEQAYRVYRTMVEELRGA